MFENKVLRKIFVAKRDEISENGESYIMLSYTHCIKSPNIIRNLKSRRLRWTGYVARMEQFRNAYRVLVGKPVRKRPLGIPKRRWEDNVKMDLREVGCDPGDCIDQGSSTCGPRASFVVPGKGISQNTIYD